MKPPRLYLAGKIGKNDWRHKLVPGLREREWKNGPIITLNFEYVGPFFKACDHGCFHGSNTHGAFNDEGCSASGDVPYSQRDIKDNNNAAMDSADLIFVYINAPDCYGTLVEIGRATAQNFRARIVIAFAPGMPVEDFWYAAIQADEVHENVRECCLPGLIANELRKVRPQAFASMGGGL